MNIYKKAIVISGCWPGKGKGYEIACNATLNFYSKYYDEIIYLVQEMSLKIPNIQIHSRMLPLLIVNLTELQ